MNSWEKTLEHLYAQDDPKYEKTEAETDVFMGRHIDNLLNAYEELMYDHEFVSAATGFLSGRKGRVIFAAYEKKMIEDKQFALDAAGANTSLLHEFDIASAAHYGQVCEVVVRGSWLAIKKVDDSRCDCMLEVCNLALAGALEKATHRQQRPRHNTFTLKTVFSTILPQATAAGMASEVVEQWKQKFENIRLDNQ